MPCELSFPCYSTADKCEIPKEERTADGKCPWFKAGFCCSIDHQNNSIIVLAKERGLSGETELLDPGKISDGYHTFDELYDHRYSLFGALCQASSSYAWKSKKHSDGTCFAGYFIAGLELPTGQISYHLPLRLYKVFPAVALPKAHDWDGHTAEEVVCRLSEYWDDPALKLFVDTIKFFGAAEQKQKAIEELAELIRGLSRDDHENIAEEMADVFIMMSQLKLIFGNQAKIAEYDKIKRNRLYRRITGKKTI